MPINFKNIISLLDLIFTIMINAQNTYKGQIENWKNPQAEIVLPLSDLLLSVAFQRKAIWILS